jgi:hypothetical protein
MSGRDGSSLGLWVRVALVVLVLGWILGPRELRGAVPILPVFLVALGLELHFLVSALRGHQRPAPDRLPQEVDRDRFGPGPEVEDDEEEEDAELEDGEEETEGAIVYEPEPRSRLAPVRRFAVGIGLIVVLGGAIWLIQSRSGWDSLSGETKGAAVKRFSEEASLIAEKQVSIRCDEARDYVGVVQHADGVAEVGGDLAILTPEICDDLYRLAFDGETNGSRTGRAVAVLAHESWHLRGEGDEGVTECYALQSGVALGQRLGLSEATARQLMRQQLTENSLRGVGTLEYRVTSECRDGGTLDLALSDRRDLPA